MNPKYKFVNWNSSVPADEKKICALQTATHPSMFFPDPVDATAQIA
jgi:hypothetical protein